MPKFEDGQEVMIQSNFPNSKLNNEQGTVRNTEEINGTYYYEIRFTIDNRTCKSWFSEDELTELNS